MKNNRLLFTLLILGVVSMASAQYNFVVQNQSARVYTSLQTAYDSAAVGDTIYIPGGSFSFPTPISKGLVWIGVGYHPDSCSATYFSQINNHITFAGDADGTDITGFRFIGFLYFGSANNPVTNLRITRCHLSNIQVKFNDQYNGGNVPTGINAKISECIIDGSVSGYLAAQVQLHNSIIKGTINDLHTSFINHCIISDGYYIHSQYNDYNLSGLENCYIKNSVINFNYNSDRYKIHATNCRFHNNIFAAPVSFPYGDNSGENNQVGVNVNALFEHLENDNLRVYTYLNDYNLKEGSVAIGAGTDGEDIGIYDGLYPFKTGGLPDEPHIRSVRVVDESTDGKLPVQVTVVAQ